MVLCACRQLAVVQRSVCRCISEYRSILRGVFSDRDKGRVFSRSIRLRAGWLRGNQIACRFDSWSIWKAELDHAAVALASWPQLRSINFMVLPSALGRLLARQQAAKRVQRKPGAPPMGFESGSHNPLVSTKSNQAQVSELPENHPISSSAGCRNRSGPSLVRLDS